MRPPPAWAVGPARLDFEIVARKGEDHRRPCNRLRVRASIEVNNQLKSGVTFEVLLAEDEILLTENDVKHASDTCLAQRPLLNVESCVCCFRNIVCRVLGTQQNPRIHGNSDSLEAKHPRNLNSPKALKPKPLKS